MPAARRGLLILRVSDVKRALKILSALMEKED
jgi:hypothetical protein